MKEIENWTIHGGYSSGVGRDIVATVRPHKNIMWKYQLTVEYRKNPDASFKKCYKTLDEAKSAAYAAIDKADAISLPELDALFK